MRVENLLVNNTAFSLAIVNIVDNKIVVKGFTHADEVSVLSIGIEDLEIWHIFKPEPKAEPEPVQPEPAVLTETAIVIEKRKRGRPRKIV
jgi:hypothetical protein